jgi:hypothetical protein
MRRNEQLSDLPYFTHEEYELMKMPLAREEVPDGALAALSAWIEGERLFSGVARSPWYLLRARGRKPCMGILVGGRNRCIDIAARYRARVWAFSPKTLPRKGKHTKGVSPVGDGVSSLDLKARGFPRHISYEHKALASLHRFPYYHSRYSAR